MAQLINNVPALRAMEAVAIDGNSVDVLVRWENGSVSHPFVVGIHDVYSRKVLAHGVGRCGSAMPLWFAFGDLLDDYGVPGSCIIDNAHRYTFRGERIDFAAVFAGFGVTVHFAMPYRGSSKPIERAWRELSANVAAHPEMSNRFPDDGSPNGVPDAKTVPVDAFRALFAEAVARYNAQDRRGLATADGGSFDERFDRSYIASPVARATGAAGRFRLAAVKGDL